VAFDGLLGEVQVPGDGGVGAAFGHLGEDGAFAVGEPVQAVGVAVPGQEPGHDVGVDHVSPRMTRSRASRTAVASSTWSLSR
jgi:hypothetical protein